MVNRKVGLFRRLLGLLLVLVVVLPVLYACDDNDDNKTNDVTAAKTTEPTATQPATAKPSGEPIKIGVIYDISGPGSAYWPMNFQAAEVARDVMYAQYGGVLGRPVEFVTCDMKSVTSNCTSCARKLVDIDKVTAVIFGGYVTAHSLAVADVTDPAKVLFPVFTTPEPVFYTDYKYVVLNKGRVEPRIKFTAEAIISELAPHTVGFLAADDPGYRAQATQLKDYLKAAGVKTVSEQYFVLDTKDFSPYLTRIKYEKPDVLVTYINYNHAQSVYKQIEELGGWGNIVHFAATASAVITQLIGAPGCQGTYAYMEWIPGLDTPGSITFQQAFLDSKGKIPDPIQAHAYTAAMIAMLAIEKAGTTDREKVALAAKWLDWESPAGRMTYNGNSWPQTGGSIGKIVDGKWVIIAVETK